MHADEPAPSGGWTAAGVSLAATGIGLRIWAAHAYREGNVSCFELISVCSWAGVAAVPLPLIGSALVGYDAYRLGAVRATRLSLSPTPLPTLLAVRFTAITVTAFALAVEGAAIAWDLYKAARCGPEAVRASPDCLGPTLFASSLVQGAAELVILVAIPTALYTIGYEKGLARRPPPPATAAAPDTRAAISLPLPVLFAGGGAGLALGARF